ncbi:hypothetical protein [Roseovarius sp.]|uniref:hypothetical protein n=1 Tax=Roseovarius sp. TaxID=1486281 RepID=UPI003A97D0B4
MSVTYPISLTLSVTKDDLPWLRRELRAGLREAFQSENDTFGAPATSVLWDGLKVLVDPPQLIAFKRNLPNFDRDEPKGGDTKFVLSVLYWMHITDSALAPNARTPRSIADELWKGRRRVTLTEAYAELETKHYPAQDDSGRWVLHCDHNENTESDFLSFALEDRQRATTAGALGIYLEVALGERAIDSELVAKFRAVRVHAEMKVNEAEVNYPSMFETPQAVGRNGTIAREGTRPLPYWDITADQGPLRGRYLPDEFIMSVRPRRESCEFTADLSVRVKDLHVEGTESNDSRAKDAIFQSLFAKSMHEDDRSKGVAVVTAQRYRVFSQ